LNSARTGRRIREFVGDDFGSALAAEGIFAFSSNRVFLGSLVVRLDRVGAKCIFSRRAWSASARISAGVDCRGQLVVQTPAGITSSANGMKARAEVTDFWQVVFNPCPWTGCFTPFAVVADGRISRLIASSAWYLLRKSTWIFARGSLRVA